MNIIKIIKENKEEKNFDIYVKDGVFIKDIKKHDSIIFICDRCNKESRKKSSDIILPLTGEIFCGSCQRKQTNLKKYGVENSSQAKETKEKTKQTNLKKYGSITPSGNKDISEKMRQTNLRRYGTNTPLQNNEIKIKARQTNIDKYGGPSPMCNEEIRGKSKISNLLNFGVEHVLQNKEILHKARQTNLKKYGYLNASESDDIKNKITMSRRKRSFGNLLNRNNNLVVPLFNLEEYKGDEEKYKWKCNECGLVFEDGINNGHIPRCKNCFPLMFGFSNKEKEVVEFVKSLGIEVVENYRDIFEIDIYIPSHSLGIEFDGIYWHSDLYKDNNYHLDKTNYFKKLGIDIIHIFEDEWNFKQEIVKSIVKSRLHLFDQIIYARKTEIKEVSSVEEREFLNNNHIQGYTPSSICLGLYYNNELVSLMSFGKSRFNKNYEWELLRFANKLNTKIIGGASKLFKNINLTNIISYCDIRYFTGEIYRTLGFNKIETSKPNYYYVKNEERYNRMKYQKHKLKDLLENFDGNLTEKENMINNGFNRIYDCGMKVFTIGKDNINQ